MKKLLAGLFLSILVLALAACGTDKKEDELHAYEEVQPNIIQNLTAQKQNETYFNHIADLKNKYSVEKF